MDEHLPHKQVLLLHDSLIDRNFQRLSEDDMFLEVFRNQCMCCGKMIGSYDDLCQHLESRHDELKRAIDCFVDMIAYYHSNDGDSKMQMVHLELARAPS